MYKYNFAAIDAALAGMQAKNTRLLQIKEQLDSEIGGWLSFWDGQALERAREWSQRVSMVLGQTIESSQQYVRTAEMANNDMRVREGQTAAQWA